MLLIDWLIVLAYLIFTMVLGVYLSRKASGSLVDFFVSGRSLPWWLAGTSMAATTFSIDTPLYVAGVVGSRGIAGNWEWWSFGIAHVVMIYIFARLWRRSEVVTDAELTEIRYGGKTAALLRGVKAFLFAVPINCIGIGYAMLAMVKVVDALELWQSLGIEPNQSMKLWSVIVVSILVLFYAGFSGLWGVVATDFFQFFLALFGAIVVAIASVISVGGMQNLINQAQTNTDFDILSILPITFNGGLGWSTVAGIPASAFTAYVFLQWWAFRRSDGGGEFIQRLVAAKNESEAEKAAWFFNILHYVIRTWPWIIVALAAVAIYPDLADRELGYPKLMLDFLPPVLLGLVVASLIAAFMSTVSTLINWGASYLTNDLYGRFINPDATQAELVNVGRMTSVIVTALGATAAFFASDVATVFRLVIAIGTGPGLVLILRWFWWRINAAAELSSMVAGFLIGLLTSSAPWFQIDDFGLRLLVTAGMTTVIWVIAMFATPPESDETLDNFYRRVRPGGPGWQKQRQRTGVRPLQNLGLEFKRVIASLLLLFGAMFAVGGFLLLNSLGGWLSLIVAVAGWFWLRHLNRQPIVPVPRPGLDDDDILP
ncbi:sodium:proline symporter [Leptolyngbyaceae cyanobacterium CCMR0082]|uniref:Sodium:proline symporter n=1 Tax=Adonisia turfae CCMR0082 TaxID=2304604 RepID=A0A6M0S624_9CYAN|nr:sodium:solute symporter family protein [Adonisia turfae]MDV3351457.1 Na+:solute symporter [Leptothoe sp. LEGE 181152]NEZ63272.1 sodium:proline symporter [Adonisia turfae CCMR0082]